MHFAEFPSRSALNSRITLCLFYSLSCTHMFMVMAMVLCPRYSETALMEAPSRSSPAPHISDTRQPVLHRNQMKNSALFAQPSFAIVRIIVVSLFITVLLIAIV